jgi:phosphoribosylamine--glycine ligase
VVLAAAGYPGTPHHGTRIDGLDAAAAAGALVFHAGTVAKDGGYATAGGRVVTVVATGADLPTAARSASVAAGTVTFAGAQWRRDIGAAAVAGAVR